MQIIHDYIASGMRHRPMTNPKSSLYKKVMKPQYITIHNAWSTAKAKALHDYVKSQAAADRPASWHFSIDEEDCYQALPTNEAGWHAGDNLGPGNTTTIGIEICDYAMRASPPDRALFLKALNHTAELCAWLIKTEPSLKPYPECLRLRQHWHWSGKNCPGFIRAEPGGWEKFVALVGEKLKEPEEIPEAVIEAPDVDREWIDNHPKEFDGKDPYQDRLTFGDLPPDRAIRERRRPK